MESPRPPLRHHVAAFFDFGAVWPKNAGTPPTTKRYKRHAGSTPGGATSSNNNSGSTPGGVTSQMPNDRPSTRSYSRLNLPIHANGSRSRSTSPAVPTSPSNSVGDVFFPAVEMSSRTFTEDKVRQIAQNAVEAALAAVPRPVVCSGRKPDLPAFDQRHIEVWIQRVEAAYARSSITSPKDKFAFLETKIDINLNPKLNEFLFGPQKKLKDGISSSNTFERNTAQHVNRKQQPSSTASAETGAVLPNSSRKLRRKQKT